MNLSRHSATCFLAGLFCFCIVCYLGWPGNIHSTEASSQFLQLQTGNFHSTTPPFFGFMWSLIHRGIQGPAGFFTLQNALFFASISILSGLVIKSTWLASMSIMCIGLGVLNVLIFTQLSKDTQFTSSLVVATTLLMLASQYDSKTAWSLAVCFLLYAFLLRYNAFLAVIPLLPWTTYLGLRIFTPHAPWRVHKIIAGTVLIGLIFSGVFIFGHRLLAPYCPIKNITLLGDLSDMSLRTNRLLIPRENISHSGTDNQILNEIRSQFDPIDYQTLIGKDGPLTIYSVQKDLLFQTWVKSVLLYPKLYLLHRLRTFMLLLGIGQQHSFYNLQPNLSQDSLGVGYPPANFFGTKRLFSWISLMDGKPPVEPWAYLLVYIFLLPLIVAKLWKQYSGFERWAISSIFISAMTYSGGYFFLGFVSALNYCYWLMHAAMILIVLNVEPLRNMFFHSRPLSIRKSQKI